MVYKIDDGFEELNSGVDDEEPEEAGPGVMGHMLMTFKHVKDKVEKVAHSPRRGKSAPSTPRSVETTQQQENKFENLQSDSPHSLERKAGEYSPKEHSVPDQNHPEEHSLLAQPELHGIESHDLGSAEDGGQIGDGFSATESSSSLETDTSAQISAPSNAERTPAGPGGHVGDRFGLTGGSSPLDAGLSPRGSARSNVEETPVGAGGHVGDPGAIEDGFNATGGSSSLETVLSPRGSARSNAEGTPAGAGGHIGNGTSPTRGSSSLEAGVSPRGSARSNGEGRAASPGLLHMDLGEKIMGKLPGCHANPYAVGGSIPTTTHANPYPVGSSIPSPAPATAQTSPPVEKSAPSSPGLFGKLEVITKLADKFSLGKLWSPRSGNSVSPDMPNTHTTAPPTDAGLPTHNTSLPTAEEGLPTGAPDTTTATAHGPTEL